MLCQPGHLGSGRACLSLEHIQQQVYGQALIVQVECNGMRQMTCNSSGRHKIHVQYVHTQSYSCITLAALHALQAVQQDFCAQQVHSHRGAPQIS